MTIGDSLILTRRLLAVLRESDRPMPTDELAELMPCKVERTRQGGCEWWCGAETPRQVYGCASATGPGTSSNTSALRMDSPESIAICARWRGVVWRAAAA